MTDELKKEINPEKRELIIKMLSGTEIYRLNDNTKGLAEAIGKLRHAYCNNEIYYKDDLDWQGAGDARYYADMLLETCKLIVASLEMGNE